MINLFPPLLISKIFKAFIFLFFILLAHVAHAKKPLLEMDLSPLNWQLHLPQADQSLADHVKTLTINTPDENWNNHNVPTLVSNDEYWSFHGKIWYRLEFDAKHLSNKTSLGLLLGRIIEANNVWLNTQFLGHHGLVDPHGTFSISDVHSIRYYPLKDGLLKPTNNVLLLEVQSMSTFPGIVSKPIGIANSGMAWRYKADTEKPILFGQSALLALVLIALIISSLSSVALKQFNREHLSFIVLFVLAFIAYSIDSLLFTQTQLKTPLLQRMSIVAGLMIPITFYYYLHSIIGLSLSRIKVYLVILISLNCVILAFSSNTIFYTIAFTVYFFLLLILILNIFYICLPISKQGNHAISIILIGFLSLIGLTIQYVISDPVNYWFRSDELGFGLFMLSLLIAYIMRLMAIQNKIKDVSLKLVNASEDERKHLAREIHDGINQRLATTRFKMQMLESKTQEDSLNPLSNELLHVMEDMDRLVQGLQPYNLERHSLAEAIEMETKGLISVKGLNIETTLEDINSSDNLSQHLYRIFQEGLQNAIKHASPQLITIELFQLKNTVYLNIKDDGKGFENVTHQANRNSLGLISMKDRVELIGGEIIIDSKKHQGTHIQVKVPIS